MSKEDKELRDTVGTIVLQSLPKDEEFTLSALDDLTEALKLLIQDRESELIRKAVEDELKWLIDMLHMSAYKGGLQIKDIQEELDRVGKN